MHKFYTVFARKYVPEFWGATAPARPVESHSGARGNHYRRALSLPHSVCPEIETLKAWRGMKHRQSCPLRDLGERRKLPQRGPKMDFMHISGQKEAIWNTIFSVFER